MFEPRFTALNMNEILKYLGFRGQELTEDIAKQLRRCTDEVLQAATPRLTYRQVPLEDGYTDDARAVRGGRAVRRDAWSRRGAPDDAL